MRVFLAILIKNFETLEMLQGSWDHLKSQLPLKVVDSGKFYKGMPKDEMIDLIASGEVYLNG